MNPSYIRYIIKFYIHPSSQHLIFPSQDLREFRKQREKRISNEEWKEIAKIRTSDFFWIVKSKRRERKKRSVKGLKENGVEGGSDEDLSLSLSLSLVGVRPAIAHFPRARVIKIVLPRSKSLS